MHYKYTAIHHIRGLSRPEDLKKETVLLESSPRHKASLVYEIDSHSLHIDRKAAMAGMILGVLVPGEKTGTFEERLEHAVRVQKMERNKRFSSGPFVVFEAEGDLEAFDTTHKKDSGDFYFCFEATPKETVRDLYVEQVNGILSALSLAAETVCGFEEVADGTVFYDNDDKPIYSFNFEAHATGYVSTLISAEALSAAAKYSRPLGKNPQLVSVARLLAESMDTESDHLRSFLSAWAGLEIFVNKVFKTYEESFLRNLTGAITPSIKDKYLDRIRSVMRDKYRLSDKFLIISSQLANESAEDDLPVFMKAKSIRDNLLHGENVKEDQLEASLIQRLLRKYLRLHLEL